MYPNGYNIYKSNSVKLASKEQILLMLVEGAVRFCKIGRQAIIEGNIQKAHDALTRTQDIFVELMVTLDREAGDWAIQLFKIYEFISYIEWEFLEELSSLFPFVFHNKKVSPPRIEVYSTNIDWRDDCLISSACLSRKSQCLKIYILLC